MAEVKNSPRNSLGRFSDLATKVKRYLNQYETKKLGKIDSPWNRYGAGHSIGDLLLGEGPEFVEDLSYGYSPFRGGNAATGGLGTHTLDKRALDATAMLPTVGLSNVPKMSALGVIKNKGGNWLETGPYSFDNVFKSTTQYYPTNFVADNRIPEQLLKDLIQTHGNGGIGWDASVLNDPRYQEFFKNTREGNVNKWINTKLKNYVKNELATPEDSIRKLMDEGITHVPRVQHDLASDSIVPKWRKQRGFPEQGLATSELGKQWELLTDWYTRPYAADYFKNHRAVVEENPWLMKLSDKAEIQPVNWDTRNLGFDHIIDEIHNMVNPQSGLPKDFQLTLDQLGRTSMADMVRRVDKINNWRKKNRFAEMQHLANNEATHLLKEYPEGYRWVELRTPTEDPAILEKFIAERTSKGTWTPGEIDAVRRDPWGTWSKGEVYGNALKDALKYEGDMMGHCVGGYCDRVMSGENRIFSLRDTKTGEPHVTIDVRNGETPSIVQVKGKGNDRPADRYQPFITDFIRDQKFPIENDLDYTDLRKYGQDYLTDKEALANPEFLAYMNRMLTPGSSIENLIKYQGHSLPGYWSRWQNELAGGAL